MAVSVVLLYAVGASVPCCDVLSAGRSSSKSGWR
jgi:hypothetical protein